MIDTTKRQNNSAANNKKRRQRSSRRTKSFYNDKITESQLMDMEDLSSSSDHSTFDARSSFKSMSQSEIVDIMGRSSQEFTLEDDDKKKKKSSKKSNKKSVSFGESSVQEFERVSSPQDVWWTDDQAEVFRRHALEMVLRLSEDEEYVWALHVLHSKNKCTPHSAERDEATHILIQHPQARGLEGNIRTAVGYRGQEKHSDAVLEAVYESNGSSSAIRKASKRTSKAAKAFASFIADFDAQEAAVVHARNSC